MNEELSDRAKGVMGIHFGMGTELTFQMAESRPSEQMLEALDELVEAGLISRHERINGHGGVRFERELEAREAHTYWTWVATNQDNPDLQFPLTVPI